MDSKGPFFFFQMAQVSVTLPETNYKKHLPGCAGPQKERIIFQASAFLSIKNLNQQKNYEIEPVQRENLSKSHQTQKNK